MPKYPENLIHFCRPVLEHYELSFEMGRMFVRSMIILYVSLAFLPPPLGDLDYIFPYYFSFSPHYTMFTIHKVNDNGDNMTAPHDAQVQVWHTQGICMSACSVLCGSTFMSVASESAAENTASTHANTPEYLH